MASTLTGVSIIASLATLAPLEALMPLTEIGRLPLVVKRASNCGGGKAAGRSRSRCGKTQLGECLAHGQGKEDSNGSKTFST